MRKCGILFSNDRGCFAKDDHGCHLESGHDGPHEFTEADGKVWQWETDWECDCEACQSDEGDYCAIYWKKNNSLVTALRNPDPD